MSDKSRTLIVTGGCDFIGSALVRHLVRETDDRVVNVDKLTYAGHPANVELAAGGPRYHFEQVDIGDLEALERIFDEYQPAGVFHLAAESHVDRSIDGPAAFLETSAVGTYNLLEVAARYRDRLDDERAEGFRFLHVSSDEVYGELHDTRAFAEETAYDPRSPY